MLSSAIFRGAFLWLLAMLAVCSATPAKKPVAIKNITANPVIYKNFPDPGLLRSGNTWYAYATRDIGSTIHIQMATSTDFLTWNIVNNTDGSQRDAMPVLPAWVDHNNWATWAPDVVQLAPNNFVMYFAATLNSTNSVNGTNSTNSTTPSHHCVGYATANNALGPYTPAATPLVCPLSQGGAIDPAGFLDSNGNRYFVYKVDGNALGHGGVCGNSQQPIVPTPLMLQQVKSDGVTLVGDPIQLINNNGANDCGIVENPSLIRTSQGIYILFFSSGCFTGPSYATYYATATNITGPYTRQPNPLLNSGLDGLDGPGGADVTNDGHMIFHAFQGDVTLFMREMHTATLTFSGTTVRRH